MNNKIKKLQFSVSMCVYSGDAPQYFDEALHSVFNQSRIPDEVVLVVDGPVSNDINDIIWKYQNSFNLRVIRLEKNMGHGIARNEGLKKCTYDYVAIADADDINDYYRFEKEMECFENDITLDVVGSGVKHFYNKVDNIISIENLPLYDKDIKKFLKKRCPFAQPTVIFKKSQVIKAGGYLDWYHAEDYYLWLRMFLIGSKFQNLEYTLVYMRSTENQLKRRGGYKYFKSLKKLFKYMLKNNIINIFEYLYNICTRFTIQVVFPAKIRNYIRKKFL